MGFKAKVFELKHYIGWGVPDDYETFKYWEDFFHDMPFHLYKKKY